jgi:uncharacterized protein (DUF39 family)
MIDRIISFVEALLLHGVLFVVIFFNLELPILAPLKSIQVPSEKVIEAIAIDEQQLVVAAEQLRLAQIQRTQDIEQEYLQLKQQQRKIERSTEREHKKLEKLQQQKARQQKKIENASTKTVGCGGKNQTITTEKSRKITVKTRS